MFVILSFLSNTGFNFVIGLLLARFLGPAQYGRFALAVAVGTVVQTVAFDWARVAAARYFAEKAEADDPRLRPTIDLILVAAMALVGGAGLLLATLHLGLPLTRLTLALAVALALVNGAFDYWTAIVRARFLDRAYARMILTKNAISAVVTLGGAYWFGSAVVAIFGLGFSMAGGALAVRRTLARPSIQGGDPDRGLAGALLAYAVPVVLANLLYQTIPLVDRLLIARDHGFAQSGQFSLAYDIGVRVVAAIGSALDVLLFQIAVRADAIHGVPHARRQIGANIGIVLAVLLPACAGLWLVLPSFEVVAVPPEFRGPFASYLRLLLPGLFCYGMIFSALNPLFQIDRRTAPLVGVAAVAALANLAFVRFWPTGADAASYAKSQVAALGLALLLLCGLALRAAAVWPRIRDLATAIGATLVMTAVCRTLPEMTPGFSSLAIQVLVGASVYAGLAYLADLCGVRGELHRKLRLIHA